MLLLVTIPAGWVASGTAEIVVALAIICGIHALKWRGIRREAGLIEARERRLGIGSPGDVPDWLEYDTAEIAGIAGLSKPEVCLKGVSAKGVKKGGRTARERVPYVGALRATESSGLILVSPGALDLLTRRELRAVMAHEVSHLLHNDSRGSMALRVLVSVAVFLTLTFHGFWLAVAACGTAWFISAVRSRRIEWRADREGARFSQDPLALASALSKIDGWKRLNTTGQTYLFEVVFGTHPLSSARIKALRRMAETTPA